MNGLERDEHLEIPTTTIKIRITGLTDNKWIPSRNPDFFNRESPHTLLYQMGFNVVESSDEGFTIEHDSTIGKRKKLAEVALRMIKESNPGMQFVCL